MVKEALTMGALSEKPLILFAQSSSQLLCQF
jgi:hypothetical protein